MGSKQSTVKNTCIEQLSNIDENDLDISNIRRPRPSPRQGRRLGPLQVWNLF